MLRWMKVLSVECFFLFKTFYLTLNVQANQFCSPSFGSEPSCGNAHEGVTSVVSRHLVLSEVRCRKQELCLRALKLLGHCCLFLGAWGWADGEDSAREGLKGRARWLSSQAGLEGVRTKKALRNTPPVRWWRRQLFAALIAFRETSEGCQSGVYLRLREMCWVFSKVLLFRRELVTCLWSARLSTIFSDQRVRESLTRLAWTVCSLF